jgi:hypothetical protein
MFIQPAAESSIPSPDDDDHITLAPPSSSSSVTSLESSLHHDQTNASISNSTVASDRPTSLSAIASIDDDAVAGVNQSASAASSSHSAAAGSSGTVASLSTSSQELSLHDIASPPSILHSVASVDYRSNTVASHPNDESSDSKPEVGWTKSMRQVPKMASMPFVFSTYPSMVSDSTRARAQVEKTLDSVVMVEVCPVIECSALPQLPSHFAFSTFPS